MGYQASYAQVRRTILGLVAADLMLIQKSRNSRLKDLEDRSSANIYCTGVPIKWNEAVRRLLFAVDPRADLTGSRTSFQALPCHLDQNLP